MSLCYMLVDCRGCSEVDLVHQPLVMRRTANKAARHVSLVSFGTCLHELFVAFEVH
jgi:hypothetical protein